MPLNKQTRINTDEAIPNFCFNIELHWLLFEHTSSVKGIWPRASLPRFHQTALQDRTGKVG